MWKKITACISAILVITALTAEQLVVSWYADMVKAGMVAFAGSVSTAGMVFDGLVFVGWLFGMWWLIGRPDWATLKQNVKVPFARPLPESPYITMREAAQQAYTVARASGHLWANIAHTASRNDEPPEVSVLSSMANMISGKIQIHGKFSPSTTLEPVRDSTKRTLSFSNGGSECREGSKGDPIVDVMIERRAFELLLDGLRNRRMPPI